jgi:hypothetical protein
LLFLLMRVELKVVMHCGVICVFNHVDCYG